jgi:hypothetical protein
MRKTKYQKLIFTKLIQAMLNYLNDYPFLNDEMFDRATPKQKADFMQEKRRIRAWLNKAADFK